MFKQLSIATAMTLTLMSQAIALPSDRTDITIFDGDAGNGGGSDTRIVDGIAVSEDGETEPGMVNSQAWDLEAFFTHGTSNLGMISGYNFQTGKMGNGHQFNAGDIFISTDSSFIAGDATRGSNGFDEVAAGTTFGYEFVIDVNWDSIEEDGGALMGQYSVYAVGSGDQVMLPFYGQNYGSGPFEFLANDGSQSLFEGMFTFEEGLSNADVDNLYAGGNHYAAYGFDLSFLGDTDFWVSNTMGCGNDHLLGKSAATAVPEPASIALLSLGLLGLGVLRRRA